MGGFGLPPTSPRKGDVLMAGEGWHVTSGSGASHNRFILVIEQGWLCKPKMKCWLRAGPCSRGSRMEASPGWAGEDDVRTGQVFGP